MKIYFRLFPFNSLIPLVELVIFMGFLGGCADTKHTEISSKPESKVQVVKNVPVKNASPTHHFGKPRTTAASKDVF